MNAVKSLLHLEESITAEFVGKYSVHLAVISKYQEKYLVAQVIDL